MDNMQEQSAGLEVSEGLVEAGTPVRRDRDLSPATTVPSFRWRDLLQDAWSIRWKMLLAAAVAALLTYLASAFLLPQYYKSTAVLLPEIEKGRASGLGQLSSLAELAGVNVSSGAPGSRLYPVIASSDTILCPVILRTYSTKRFSEPVNLVQYLELTEKSPAENMERALKIIRTLLTSAIDPKTNVVTLTLEMEEPQLAADVLNAIVADLDLFMRQKRKTNASEQVIWIQTRMGQVDEDLRQAEDRLRAFRERNRRLSDSPELTLQQERLLRDVQIKSTVSIELKKQLELARIDEIKNLTLVNVLDNARPPVKRERPRRLLNSVVAFLLTLALIPSARVGWPILRSKVHLVLSPAYRPV